MSLTSTKNNVSFRDDKIILDVQTKFINIIINNRIKLQSNNLYESLLITQIQEKL